MIFARLPDCDVGLVNHLVKEHHLYALDADERASVSPFPAALARGTTPPPLYRLISHIVGVRSTSTPSTRTSKTPST